MLLTKFITIINRLEQQFKLTRVTKNNIRKFHLLATLILFFYLANTNDLFGQNKDVTSGNQQWFQYYNETQLSEKWAWLSDAGYRWQNGFKESSQYLIRIGIGYNLNSNCRVSSGFAHLGFYSNDVLNRMEFRPYQEVQFKHNFNKIDLNHRYRIEERFSYPYNNNQTKSESTFNFRFRYSIMVGIPLFKLRGEKEIILNIGNEIFINAGKDIVNNVFDQNRFIISPSFKLNKQLTFSLTGNNQFASTTTQGNFENTYIIWLQIKHKLTLKKKKQNK